MTRNTEIGSVVLCLAIALITAGASAAGLFLRVDGAFEPVTSVRGEEYEMWGSAIDESSIVRV